MAKTDEQMPDLRGRFEREVPSAYFVDATRKDELEAYLKDHGWTFPGDKIMSIARAGDGNMNLTLRVDMVGQSLIVKQSRSWVEKFPQIDAPAERAIVEGQFYQLIQMRESLRNFTPRMVGLDPESSVLVLEDLGRYNDFTYIYDKDEYISEADIAQLTRFITHLHQQYTTDTTEERIPNRAMRRLNHEHLFVFPLLDDNGMDLDAFTTGLNDVATRLKADKAYVKKVLELGEVYLADGKTLLHGDFYPASWMKTDDGVKIIDPEFCFFGPAEFELGVFTAHLKLGEQGDALIEQVFGLYQGFHKLNPSLVCHFCGVEIMRRLIGIAQLPLTLDLEEKIALLEETQELILRPEAAALYSMLVSVHS